MLSTEGQTLGPGVGFLRSRQHSITFWHLESDHRRFYSLLSSFKGYLL